MSLRVATFCLAGLLLSILGATSQPTVNDRCPVMPEELAKAVHEINFRGVPVRFCCQQCKAKFLRNPGPYLAQLPHVPKAESKPPPRAQDSAWFRLLDHRVVRNVEQFATHWRWLMAAVLSILVTHLAAARWQKKHVTDPPRRSAVVGGIRLAARPSTVVALFGGMGLLWLLQPSAEHALEQGGTAGDPSLHVKAAEFQSQLTRQGIMQGSDFVSRMEKTYYRGNDDRSPKLFNGGVYRTCEFRISLRTAKGKLVTPGETVVNQPLVVRVEIHRSKNTMESHFEDDVMTQTFLVCRAELPSIPSKDGAEPVPFKVVLPGQVWVAEAAIGTPPSTGIQHLHGTVLLCPAAGVQGDELWHLAHYGVAYQLRFQDGSLARSSKMWLGAVVLPLDLADDQFYEWLDIKPLPEVPDDFRHPSETDEPATQPED